MTGVLAAGQKYHFHLHVPNALKVAVVAGDQWTQLKQDGNEFTGDATATTGNVLVCAKFESQVNFAGLLKYTGQ
jgi:hypothetical protein